MSEKSIAEKLQVKADRTLAVLNAKSPLDRLLGAPERRAPPHSADVVVLFAANRNELEATLPSLILELQNSAIFWVAYPKLTSPLASDLNRDVIRDRAPSFGLDTVSQIAIDADWSALRLKRTDQQR